MGVEVRYERMRPREVVAARQACPVAYLPVGTIEWHGRHLPLGADVVLSHGLAVRCAQAGGGLAFPPLAYGESRLEGLMEANAADREQIAAEMDLPPVNFTAARFRFSVHQQAENYQRLLLHCLCELQSLGFRLAVLVAGHFPLIDHARVAAGLFHQMRWDNRRALMLTWAFTGHELVTDRYPTGGHHAGFWETSMCLALEPGLVDLSELPKDPAAKLVGVLSPEPTQEASAEFGEQVVQLIVERAVAQVRDRLANPEAYYAHGLRL